MSFMSADVFSCTLMHSDVLWWCSQKSVRWLNPMNCLWPAKFV